MFIVNWFWDVLAQLGLPASFLFPRLLTLIILLSGLLHKNAKILFLGLDNAGKTVRPFYTSTLLVQ